MCPTRFSGPTWQRSNKTFCKLYRAEEWPYANIFAFNLACTLLRESFIESAILLSCRMPDVVMRIGRKRVEITYYIFITDETSALDQEVVAPQKQRFHFDRSFILYIYYPPSILHSVYI